jgi:hypothetical protein
MIPPPPGRPADIGTGFPACTGSYLPLWAWLWHHRTPPQTTVQYLPSHRLQFLHTFIYRAPPFPTRPPCIVVRRKKHHSRLFSLYPHSPFNSPPALAPHLIPLPPFLTMYLVSGSRRNSADEVKVTA